MSDQSDQRYDPLNQQTQQTEGQIRQSGDEDDPTRGPEIPHPESGETRWVRRDNQNPSVLDPTWTQEEGVVTRQGNRIASTETDQSGTPGQLDQAAPVDDLDPNRDWNPQNYAIQGDMMGVGETFQGRASAHVMEDELAPESLPKSKTDNPVVGEAGPPDEAYGQGETRQFTPLGDAPGITQQEELQSQQYDRARETQEKAGGILGTVGRAVEKLFGGEKGEEKSAEKGEEKGAPDGDG
jgi:hypothetical protein